MRDHGEGAHGDRLLSLHGHNEASRLDRVADRSGAGDTVAVVSDAGTPGVSDPGAWLAAQLAAAGATVTTVPGPSAVLGALVVSGLPADRFGVEGFLPRKGPERRRRLATFMADARTTVVLEAPSRVASTLAELAATDEARRVAVVRELTKLHEEVWRGALGKAAAVAAGREVRGEVVLVSVGHRRRPRPTRKRWRPRSGPRRRRPDGGPAPGGRAGGCARRAPPPCRPGRPARAQDTGGDGDTSGPKAPVRYRRCPPTT